MSQCTNRDLPALAGRFLKQELIARGITQEQFAEMAHVSDRTVRRWVSGEIHSLDALSDIANALQVEVRDIFAEDVPAYFLHRTHPVLFMGHMPRYNTKAITTRKEECTTEYFTQEPRRTNE